MQGHAGGNVLDFFSYASSDSMHPTIAQDMNRFDMGNTTLNSNLFLDFSGPPSMSQVHLPDLRGPDFYPTPSYQMYQPTPTSQSLASYEQHQSAPVLDATWQSFVEQLGF